MQFPTPPKFNAWDNSKKTSPVVLKNHNPQQEFEFHHAQGNAKPAYFLSNGPVDIDEALQQNGKNNFFVTAIGEPDKNNIGKSDAVDNVNTWAPNANNGWSQENQNINNIWGQNDNNKVDVATEENVWDAKDQGWNQQENQDGWNNDNIQNGWGDSPNAGDVQTDNGWNQNKDPSYENGWTNENYQTSPNAWDQQDPQDHAVIGDNNVDPYETATINDQASEWKTAEIVNNSQFETIVQEKDENAWGGENSNAGDIGGSAEEKNAKDEENFETANIERGESVTPVQEDTEAAMINNGQQQQNENKQGTEFIDIKNDDTNEKDQFVSIEDDGEARDAITPRPPEWTEKPIEVRMSAY